MEENSCSDSHVEPPSDVDEGDVVGNTSPYISHPVFPSVEPSSPSDNNNGFTFLPSKTFPENVEDLCFLELAKLIREIGAPLSTFSKILACLGGPLANGGSHFQDCCLPFIHDICGITVKKTGTGLSQV